MFSWYPSTHIITPQQPWYGLLEGNTVDGVPRHVERVADQGYVGTVYPTEQLPDISVLNITFYSITFYNITFYNITSYKNRGTALVLMSQ